MISASRFGVVGSPDSMRASVRIETPEFLERALRVHPISDRPARICDAVIRVALFVPFAIDFIVRSMAQMMPLLKGRIHTKEIAMAISTQETKSVTIPAAKFGRAEFLIEGTAPLVIHRFSHKTTLEMKQKREVGKAAGNKKNREAKLSTDLYNEARYISKEGWDGFHAGAIRNALISACRLVGFKMTIAKLSIFVEADGRDAQEPQIPLVRIIGKPVMQEDMARVATGQPYVTVRAAFHEWKAKVSIRWDEDQFTLTDVTNLLSRVGQQVGLCEGRPDSPNSAGMGWGLFEIAKTESKKVAA